MLKLIGIFRYFGLCQRMQRIFKCGNIQSTSLTPDKELNILMFIDRLYTSS